eukprot:Blabericola_migrator_1__826@NODE_1202_length_5123_cov_39_383900_g814_i0_p3_GENE_NODE_1202_length_5123_cov_39_383900_g814_i0NODE_1202_length_5123_cov_39_383900_g814_i0_p3_ORF_typecomplete_len358_score69_03Histone_HNS/PF00816_21/6_5e03Histone_HNS/PF00816_21/1_5e03Histone_HNS/PF00816_21/0_028_NODE_1202_length_5123_cov_39_383900_g814_i03201393
MVDPEYNPLLQNAKAMHELTQESIEAGKKDEQEIEDSKEEAREKGKVQGAAKAAERLTAHEADASEHRISMEDSMETGSILDSQITEDNLAHSLAADEAATSLTDHKVESNEEGLEAEPNALDVEGVKDTVEAEVAGARAATAQANASVDEAINHEKRVVERENLEHEILAEDCPPGYITASEAQQRGQKTEPPGEVQDAPPCPVAVLDAPCPCVMEWFESGPPMQEVTPADEEGAESEIEVIGEEMAEGEAPEEKAVEELEEELHQGEDEGSSEKLEEALEPADEHGVTCEDLHAAVQDKVSTTCNCNPTLLILIVWKKTGRDQRRGGRRFGEGDWPQLTYPFTTEASKRITVVAR